MFVEFRCVVTEKIVLFSSIWQTFGHLALICCSAYKFLWRILIAANPVHSPQAHAMNVVFFRNIVLTKFMATSRTN